jgi:hypothetical protein
VAGAQVSAELPQTPSLQNNIQTRAASLFRVRRTMNQRTMNQRTMNQRTMNHAFDGTYCTVRCAIYELGNESSIGSEASGSVAHQSSPPRATCGSSTKPRYAGM